MRPELIVMLTHKDKTVPEAVELFESLKDCPVQHWGFKDVGLPRTQMKILVENMKKAGKTTYLEVVSLSEQEGLEGAKICRDCGFDILMGTIYYDSILAFLKDSPVKYYPFIGKVYGHPSILGGTVDETVAQAISLAAKGVDGFDLLTYRYKGDAARLLAEVVRVTKGLPVVSAGSVDSLERIAEIRDTGAWGFTIGSAFFEKKFNAQGYFRENTMAVWNWLQKNGTDPGPPDLLQGNGKGGL